MLRRVLIFTLLVTGLAIWLVAKVCRMLLARTARTSTASLAHRAFAGRPGLDRNFVPVVEAGFDLD